VIILAVMSEVSLPKERGLAAMTIEGGRAGRAQGDAPTMDERWFYIKNRYVPAKRMRDILTEARDNV
jgi:hypothetical protein